MPKVTMHRVPKLLTLSTLPVSQAVKMPRVLPCEPLCTQFGAGAACVPDESCLPHTARDAGIVAHSGGGDGKQSVRPTKSDGRRKFCGALPHTR